MSKTWHINSNSLSTFLGVFGEVPPIFRFDVACVYIYIYIYIYICNHSFNQLQG